MEINKILEKVRQTESPLKRQLLLAALITFLLKDKGKEAPIVIGGCALSYYSREVYFTADIDLAYADREALNDVLKNIGFIKKGRYWINEDLKVAIEVPASISYNSESPLEIVEIGEGLFCNIIGIEDLIIDRLNAFKHWKSEIDCEMVELLLRKYYNDIHWDYLETKASRPENEVISELLELKTKIKK